MNSHITIPNSVLLNYTDETSGKISYYDFSKGDIINISPYRYNTYMDYYSEEFEKWLSAQIERTIGKLLESLNRIKANTVVTDKIIKDSEKVKFYLVRITIVQILRLPDYEQEIDNIINNFAFNTEIDLSTRQRRRDNFYNPTRIDNLTHDTVDRNFKNHIVSFITVDDNCENTFALTPSLYFQQDNSFIFPFTPKQGFMLKPKNEMRIRHDSKGIHNIKPWYVVSDNDLLDFVPWYRKICENQSTLKHLIAPKPFLKKIMDGGLLK